MRKCSLNVHNIKKAILFRIIKLCLNETSRIESGYFYNQRQAFCFQLIKPKLDAHFEISINTNAKLTHKQHLHLNKIKESFAARKYN